MSPVAGQNGSAHLADINITPLVDVMLTVLVIFMITAPVVTRVIPVPLHGAAGQPNEARVLAVGIADNGALSVNARAATLTEMEVLVDAATSQNVPVRIDLRPTAGSTYTDLVDVLALASRHGVTNVRIEGVAGND